jgi:hypothetical protein
VDKLREPALRDLRDLSVLRVDLRAHKALISTAVTQDVAEAASLVETPVVEAKAAREECKNSLLLIH